MLGTLKTCSRRGWRAKSEFVPLMTFADVCACSAMLGGRSNERRAPKVGKSNGGRAEVTHDPMRQVDVDRRLRRISPERLVVAPGRVRAGRPCRQAAVRGRERCRVHGGAKGSGGPRGERNGNYKQRSLELLEEVQAPAPLRRRGCAGSGLTCQRGGPWADLRFTTCTPARGLLRPRKRHLRRDGPASPQEPQGGGRTRLRHEWISRPQNRYPSAVRGPQREDGYPSAAASAAKRGRPSAYNRQDRRSDLLTASSTVFVESR